MTLREVTYLRDKVKNRIETRQKMKGHIIRHLDREVERHTDVLARATLQEQELTQGRGPCSAKLTRSVVELMRMTRGGIPNSSVSLKDS